MRSLLLLLILTSDALIRSVYQPGSDLTLVTLMSCQYMRLQDLDMPGNHVDVNLHPTKREVGFLHQDELLERIRVAVEDALLSSNDK